MKVSTRIEKQRAAQTANQAAQNTAAQKQQALLDTPLSKITSAMIEAMDSDTYKKMLVQHGEAFAAKSLPVPKGIRRADMADTQASVRTRDMLARQISPEAQALIQDGIRKTRQAELEEGARILSEAEEKKRAAKFARLFNKPYTGKFALILDEAVRMTEAKYDELSKMTQENVRHQALWTVKLSQDQYPIGLDKSMGQGYDSDGKLLTDDETAKVLRFCVVNEFDLMDEGNIFIAYLILKAEDVLRSKVHDVVVKFDLEDEPARMPEPTSITMQKNPWRVGSREYEEYEREAHDFNRFVEIDGTIGEFITEIGKASNMRVPADAEEWIYNALTKHRLPATRENVRRQFYARWFREVPPGVFSQDEINRWNEERRVDHLSAADYLRENVLGVPTQWQHGKR
jgi:hypothetical protein